MRSMFFENSIDDSKYLGVLYGACCSTLQCSPHSAIGLSELPIPQTQHVPDDTVVQTVI